MKLGPRIAAARLGAGWHRAATGITRIALVTGAGLLLAAQTHAADIPPTQFLAVGRDPVRTECIPSTGCGFLFGDSAMSPIPVAVHLADSGADFSRMVDASTVTGPSIADLKAAISAGASGGGQPAAEAVVKFWIDVQPTSSSAPSVPVPVDILLRLDASTDVSSASDADGDLEAEAELQSSGNLLDSVRTSCSVIAHDASCDQERGSHGERVQRDRGAPQLVWVGCRRSGSV